MGGWGRGMMKRLVHGEIIIINEKLLLLNLMSRFIYLLTITKYFDNAWTSHFMEII